MITHPTWIISLHIHRDGPHHSPIHQHGVPVTVLMIVTHFQRNLTKKGTKLLALPN